jgi:release factor glutamine methyltransferase
VPPRPEVVEALRAAGCVLADEEAALLERAARNGDHLLAMVGRRVDGIPLEVVLGGARFHEVDVTVQPGVFVPRRRSEHLVEEALRHVRPGSVVVELCCGTGAIGLAVATRVPVELHAVDVDEAAVRCASANLRTVGGTAYLGDLDAPLPARLSARVDVLLASPPYVPTDEVALLPREARDHEPRRALDGGADGLDVVRRIAAAARRWLAPGAVALVETGHGQSAAAVDLFRTQQLEAWGSCTDEASVVVARRLEAGQIPIEVPATEATSSASPSSTTSDCSLRP